MLNKAASAANCIASLVLLGIFVAIYLLTLDMTPRDRAFPQIILQLLIGLDVVLFIVSLKPGMASLKDIGETAKDNFKGFMAILLKYIIPTLAYFFFVRTINFFAASFLYMVGMAFLFRTRAKTVILGSCGVILCVYFVFTYLLKINI